MSTLINIPWSCWLKGGVIFSVYSKGRDPSSKVEYVKLKKLSGKCLKCQEKKKKYEISFKRIDVDFSLLETG